MEASKIDPSAPYDTTTTTTTTSSDETRELECDPQNKRQSLLEGYSITTDQKSKTVEIQIKLMPIAFFDVRGMIRFEFLPQTQKCQPACA